MSLSRSGSKANWTMEKVFGGPNPIRRSIHADEDEEALRLAALEKLPTYSSMRTSIIKSFIENGDKKVVHKEVEVRNLDLNDRQKFIDGLFKVAEEDNEKFLQKFRHRIKK